MDVIAGVVGKVEIGGCGRHNVIGSRPIIMTVRSCAVEQAMGELEATEDFCDGNGVTLRSSATKALVDFVAGLPA